MKASKAVVERALDRPTEDVRCFLLYGPDEPGSRALAERLARAMGPDAERVDLEGGALAKDPALLADEAASVSLFGSARHIRLRVSGDEAIDAVEALIAAPRTGNPVVILAGVLKATSKLLKLIIASPQTLAFASYPLEGGDADRLAVTLARELGIRLASDAARDLVAACAADRAVIQRELEKLALYLDASPERPCEAGRDTLADIIAGSGEGDLSRLVDAALSGAPGIVVRELDQLAAEGIDGIAVLRAATRRVLLLIQLRADVAAGASPEAAVERGGKALFWKDKPIITRQLMLWSPDRLATAANRLFEAQQAMLAPRTAGAILASAEMLAIGRAAAARR